MRHLLVAVVEVVEIEADAVAVDVVVAGVVSVAAVVNAERKSSRGVELVAAYCGRMELVEDEAFAGLPMCVAISAVVAVGVVEMGRIPGSLGVAEAALMNFVVLVV